MRKETIAYPHKGGGVVRRWLVRPHEVVDEGQALCEIWSEASRDIVRLPSPLEGTIERLIVAEGAKVSFGEALAILTICPHDIQFGFLCGICGVDLSSQKNKQASISIIHNQPGITITMNEAKRVEHDTALRLRKERKLSLVLDLDHTLIHAATEQWFFHSPPARHMDFQKEDVKQLQLPGVHGRYFVKLRPGLAEFLTEANQLFEVHMYTFGTKSYANLIAQIIDPNHHIFKERILSRDECGGDITTKNLKRIFPCDDSMVLIVDDREDVWKKSRNLIRIEPFHFFTSGEVNPRPQHEGHVRGQNKESHRQKRTSSRHSRHNNTPSQQHFSQPQQQHQQQPQQPNQPQPQQSPPQIPKWLQKNTPENKENNTENNETNNETNTENNTENTDVEKMDVEPTKPVETQPTEPTETQPTTDDKPTEQQQSEPANEQTEQITKQTEQPEAQPETNSPNSENSEPSPNSESNNSPNPENSATETNNSSIETNGTGTNDTNPNPNANPNPNPNEIQAPPPPPDTYLDITLNVLRKIHKNFYAAAGGDGADVKNILTSLKREVLAGTHIVFSGFCPSNVDPSTTVHWITAERYGATCSANVTDQTTHVIAYKKGTQKVYTALSTPGIYLVNENWLWKSISNWRHLPEEDFSLENLPVLFAPRKSAAPLAGMMSSEQLADMDREVDECLADSDDEDDKEETNDSDENETENGHENGNGNENGLHDGDERPRKRAKNKTKESDDDVDMIGDEAPADDDETETAGNEETETAGYDDEDKGGDDNGDVRNESIDFDESELASFLEGELEQLDD